MTQAVSYVTIGRLTRPHGIRGEICAQYYAQSLQYLENGQAFLKTEKSAPQSFTITACKEQGNILVLKIKGVNSRTEAEFLRNVDIVIDDTLLAYEDRMISADSCAFENDGNIDYRDGEGESLVTSAHLQNIESSLEQAPFLYHLIGAKVYLCKAYMLANTQEQKNFLVQAELVQADTVLQGAVQQDAVQAGTNEQGLEPFLGQIEDIIFPADQEIWCIKTEKDEEILFPAVSTFVDRYDLRDLTAVKVYLNPPIGLLEIYMDDTTE